MLKNFKWVFFAFSLILATMLPSTVYASTMTYDDLPGIVKSTYSKDDQFAFGHDTFGNPKVILGHVREGKYLTTRSVLSNGTLNTSSNFNANEIRVKFSTYDIKNTDGTVFFSKPMAPIPKALSQVLPNLLSQSTRILPVGLVVLSALLVVSLIPKVLYRLF